MATVMNPNLQSPWLSPSDPRNGYPHMAPTAGPSHSPYDSSPYAVHSYPPTPGVSAETRIARGQALPQHATYNQLLQHSQHQGGYGGVSVAPDAPRHFEYPPPDDSNADYPQMYAPQEMQPIPMDKALFTRTSQQNRDILEYWFRRYDKPFGDLRAGLLAECNMDPRTLQVWFQNRRSKEKSLRRKARKKAKLEWMAKYKLQPPPHEDDSDFEFADESDEEPSTGSEEMDNEYVELMPSGKKGKRKVPKKKVRRRDETRWATLLPVGPGENPGSSAVLRNFPVPLEFPFRERNYEIPPPQVLRAQGWPLVEIGESAPKGRRASLANGEASRIAHTPQHQAVAARRGSVPYPLSASSSSSSGFWNHAYETPVRQSRTPLVKMATQNNRRASTPAILHNQFPFAPARNTSGGRRNLPPIKDHADEHLQTTLNPIATTYAPDFASLTESPTGYPPAGPLPNPHFAFGSGTGYTTPVDVPRYGAYRDRLGSVASEWTVNTETPTDAPTEDSFDNMDQFHYNGDARRASAPAGMVDGIQQLAVMTGVRQTRPSPLSANSFGHPGETHDERIASQMNGDMARLQASLHQYSSSPLGAMAPPMHAAVSHDSGLPSSMQALHTALHPSQSNSTIQSAGPSVAVSPVQSTHLPGMSYSTQVSPENVTHMPPYGAFDMNTGEYSTVYVDPSSDPYEDSSYEYAGQYYDGPSASERSVSNGSADHP